MHTPRLTKTMPACMVSAVDLIAVIVDGGVSGHGIGGAQTLYLPL